MKHDISITELRSNIYAIIDEVIATGEPVVVRRHNATVTLQPPKKAKKKAKNKIINDLSKIVPIKDLLTEDPEFYRHIEWNDWQPNIDV